MLSSTTRTLWVCVSGGGDGGFRTGTGGMTMTSMDALGVESSSSSLLGSADGGEGSGASGSTGAEGGLGAGGGFSKKSRARCTAFSNFTGPNLDNVSVVFSCVGV